MQWYGGSCMTAIPSSRKFRLSLIASLNVSGLEWSKYSEVTSAADGGCCRFLMTLTAEFFNNDEIFILLLSRCWEGSRHERATSDVWQKV